MDSEDLKFNEDHIWVKVSAKKGRIGISDYAQSELGEVLYFDLPIVGDKVKRTEPFGEIESSETVSELISPVSGKVIGVNEDLEDNPSIINDDPYGEGWLIEVEIVDPSELDSLLDSGEYERFVEEQK